MKTEKLLIFVILIALFSACETEQVLPDTGMSEDLFTLKSSSSQKSSTNGFLYNATGSVEIEWKGGNKGRENGNKPDALLTFFDIDAKQKDISSEAKGELVYLVLETDMSPHREIRAEVTGLHIEREIRKAWILGRVISDSKGCAGNGGGGHDSGCADDHTDGGCTDDHSDGGCSDDHTDGGCTDDHTDGGCTDDDSHDGGCSGHGDSDTDHGGMGGSGGSDGDKGNPLSGKNCRLGQVIAVKFHDGGTPGTRGDGITWKWFDPESPQAPIIEQWNEWSHLCKKTIIGGNLVIHY